MIKAILIDDEAHCLKTLGHLLRRHCPEVEITAECNSAAKGLEAIERNPPSLVFLDIEMPVMNGFEMLERFSDISFALIFTTSYDQYALKAFRFSALDYLLKPIDSKELIAAVNKVKTQKMLPRSEQFELLLRQIHHSGSGFKKIAVPTVEGYELLQIDHIVRCEADDNYTHLVMKNGRKVVASRTLKEIEEMMQDFRFFVRVHHSHFVNLNEVVRYVRADGGYLIMSDESNVSVSRSRREALIKWFA